MNPTKQRLYNRMVSKSDSMELLPNGQVSTSQGIGASIQQIVGNPEFKAEISLQVYVRYYSQAVVGTPAAVVPGAGQQNNLPVYLFGANDADANFARSRQLVSGGGGFTYNDMAIIKVGSGQVGYFPLPHAPASVEYISGTIYNNLAQNGDLLFLIPMTGFVAGAAATTVTAEVLVRCPNVPYTSFLAALNSDTAFVNMIRYTVPVAAVAQLTNQITLIKGSLFGKNSTDTLDPQTFITPGTFQAQIADIPITLPLDKNIIAATTMTYTATVPITFTWTLTIASINKLSA